MAGLLYLPKFLFIIRKIIMKLLRFSRHLERKLFYYIMTAMVLSWLFGLLLISKVGFYQLGSLWLQLKLIFVVILTCYHFYLGVLLDKFKYDKNIKSSKFYRYINEIPTLLLILIIFVVIFKPI